MVVTIQRELADRLIAPPSSGAYGAISVLVQALAEVSIVRGLPPSVFWPRPKVDSSVVAIRPDAARRPGRRRRLVPPVGAQRLPPSPQVRPPRPDLALARRVDEGRRRRLARVAGTQRPAPRRGARRRGFRGAGPRAAGAIPGPRSRRSKDRRTTDHHRANGSLGNSRSIIRARKSGRLRSGSRVDSVRYAIGSRYPIAIARRKTAIAFLAWFGPLRGGHTRARPAPESRQAGVAADLEGTYPLRPGA